MLSSGIHPQPGFYDSMQKQETEKTGTYRLNQVAIRLVEMPPLLSDVPLDGPEAAVKVMADMLKDYDREVVAIVNMQSDGRPINMNIVSMGALDQSIAHPREILKSTILSNAASIMMVHNHPSNKLTPSAEDIATTARIKQLCDLVGVRFLDHIIVGPGKDYYSFHQRDQIPLSSLKLTRNLGDIELEGFKVAENTAIKEEMQTKKIVTLTVAECSEFHNLGEFHENIKIVAEAIEKFQAIPPERMHGIPGIGIRVADAKDPEDCVEMDIVTGKRIDLDMLSYVPDIADNWQAQQMIAALIHEMPEAEICGEIPENIQKKVNWLESRTSVRMNCNRSRISWKRELWIFFRVTNINSSLIPWQNSQGIPSIIPFLL